MESTNRLYKYTRSFVLISAAMATTTLIAYLGLSAIVTRPRPSERAEQPRQPLEGGTTALSLPIEQTLSDGEELVQVPAVKVPQAPLEYVVRVRASVTEEAGADIKLTVVPGACLQQPAGRNYVSQSSAASLATVLDRTLCLRSLRTAAIEPHVVQPVGRWGSVATDELPELTELVRQVAYVDESGHPVLLSVSVTGYCESAEGGCNSAVNVETISVRDNPTTRLRLPGVGLAPLYFSAGAR